MADVIATERGYYGGSIREPGERFDAEGTASWFRPVGRSVSSDDHDGTDDPGQGDDLDGLTIKELRELAKDRGISIPSGVTAKADIVATISAGRPSAAPFSDAPEPIRVKNEINDLTGANLPDWVQG